MLELYKGVQSIVEACMEIKAGERVLIVADNELLPMAVGEYAMDAISALGADVTLAIVPPRQHSAQEPPVAVAAAWKTVNVVLQLSDRQGMAHTNARKDGTAAGIRYYTMVQVPADEIKKGITAQEVRLIKDRTERMAELLGKAGVAKITTPAGTNLTMGLKGRPGVALHGMSHAIGSIPAYGEAAIAPLEGTSEGTAVIDVGAVGWGYLFREPLRLTIKKGRMEDIKGKPEDVARLQKLASTDDTGNNIGELGIGTSHVLPLELRGSRRDCARAGLIHIAIGRNNDFGGETYSKIHLDLLMGQPTLELDGKDVIKDGELQI